MLNLFLTFIKHEKHDIMKLWVKL